MIITDPGNIVISRTDSIGDVCLTLPLAGILKEKFPTAKIIFLGNSYTRPVIECCKHVDEVWEWSELSKRTQQEQIEQLKKASIDTFVHVFPRKEIARLAKKAGIQHRIGTSHRIFHFTTCNFRPGFTRKNSDSHEAQLNTKLLSAFGVSRHFELPELKTYAAFQSSYRLPETFEKLTNTGKKSLILHPKSQGSAREWDIQNFIDLANELKNKDVNVFFTGTEKEGLLFRHLLPKSDHIVDLTGKMTLQELIVFISKCDGLIAASTGPLHIAGLTGINAIGLFSDKRPIHPGRWKPLGNKVIILEEKNISNPTQPLNIPLRDVLRVAEELL